MKKIINVLIAVLMIACLAVTFTACKNGCDQGDHDMQLVSVDEATCTVAKTEHYKCAHCDHTEDRTVDSAPALGHDYTGAAWTPNGDKHERTCVRPGCGYKDSQNHTPTAGTNGIPADCLHDGVTADTVCSDCGATIAAGTKIDALGHDFDATIEANVSNKQDATCTEAGHMTVKCSRCEVTEQQTIKAYGHTLTYDVTEDTHTEKCSKCSYVGTPTAHVNTDGKCVCGKLFTDFNVTDYETIKASVSADKKESDGFYFAIGVIKNIEHDYYGNMTIVAEDGTELYVYGVLDVNNKQYGNLEVKPVAGEVIVLYGKVSYYNGAQLKNAVLVQHKATVVANLADIAGMALELPAKAADNFALPTVDGATITWTVDGAGLTIQNNETAVISQTTEDQTVTVTAAITVGSDNATKMFTVVIAKLGEKSIALDFSKNSEGVSGTQGNQTVTNGIVTYSLGDGKANTGYLMIYSGGWFANVTPIPGAILKVEYVVTTGAAKATEYYITFGKTAMAAKTTTGTKTSTGKGDGESVTGSLTATEADGYYFFNITPDKGNGQLVKVIITYKPCTHAETTDVPATNATCTEAATIAHKTCNACGVMLNGENQVIATATTGEALGHNYGDLVEATEATCITEGNVAHYHCDRCEKDFNETKTAEIADVTIAINPDAHNYEYDVDPTDATKHIGTCSYNHNHKTESEDHTPGDWVTTDAAEHWKVCSVCKAEVERGDHDFSNGACECGKTQDAVTFAVKYAVAGYEGTGVVPAENGTATTGVAFTFEITIPDGYELDTATTSIDGVTISETATKGTYTFTVTKEQLASNTEITVTVTLTVAEKSWKKVTSLSDLENGSIVVLTYENNVAGNLSGKFIANVTGLEVSEDKSTITTLPTDAMQFTLGYDAANDTWTFTTSEGKLIGLSRVDNNNLNNTGSGTTTWKLTVNSNGSVTIVSTLSNTCKLQFNSNSGQERFSNYKTGTQKDVTMYVYA